MRLFYRAHSTTRAAFIGCSTTRNITLKGGICANKQTDVIHILCVRVHKEIAFPKVAKHRLCFLFIIKIRHKVKKNVWKLI